MITRRADKSTDPFDALIDGQTPEYTEENKRIVIGCYFFGDRGNRWELSPETRDRILAWFAGCRDAGIR
jgi:hypothetical protein